MTIAISTKIGEGLVYAADSTSTLFETFDTADGPQTRLVQSFHHARKLIQLERYPVGIMTFGLSMIGTRNLESLVAEYERSRLTPYELTQRGAGFTVEAVAADLHDFLRAKYDIVHPPPVGVAGQPAPPDDRPQMGVIVGGFSANEFYPDEWQILLPTGAPIRVRDDPAGNFGVRWWGITTPLMRLIGGIDPGIEQWMVDQGIDQQNAEGIYLDLIGRFRWNIVFDGMLVQDAIDLAVFLANIAIGHSRFVVGPPVCGGHVDVAAITHNGFFWVRQKKSSVKGDSVFF